MAQNLNKFHKIIILDLKDVKDSTFRSLWINYLIKTTPSILILFHNQKGYLNLTQIYKLSQFPSLSNQFLTIYNHDEDELLVQNYFNFLSKHQISDVKDVQTKELYWDWINIRDEK